MDSTSQTRTTSNIRGRQGAFMKSEDCKVLYLKTCIVSFPVVAAKEERNGRMEHNGVRRTEDTKLEGR